MIYSFLNVNCNITGPGGSANLGAGAAVAEEGIEFEPVENKNEMNIGADGKGQHSLIASNAAKIIVRLLKTSPINQILQVMYDLQSTSSALWGINTINTVDSGRGDAIVSLFCAFQKQVPLKYAKVAGLNEWIFDCINNTVTLGSGQ